MTQLPIFFLFQIRLMMSLQLLCLQQEQPLRLPGAVLGALFPQLCLRVLKP
jgi:hypothetical protein